MTLVTPRGRGLGFAKDDQDDRDWVYDALSKPRLGAVTPTGGLLPTELPSIWDQLQIGACTSHGTLRAFIARLMQLGIQLPLPPPGGAPFSRLQQYWNTRYLEGTTDQDAGGQVRDAIKALAQFGVAPETEWVYDTTRFADAPPSQAVHDALKNIAVQYHRIIVGSPGAPLRTALLNKEPFVFGFHVPDYFEDPSVWDPTSGEPLPLPDENTQYLGWHCVAGTYYNFSNKLVSGPYYTGRRGCFFTCDNSWSPGWGMGGRFNIDSEWFNPSRGLSSDFWVISLAR